MSKILSALPNLLILNGQATKDEVISVKEIDITDDQVEELSLNNEIDNFNAVLDSISLLPNYTKYFKGNFMEKLKEEIDILNSNCNISNYLFCVNVLKAKFNMYHFLHDQLIDLCDPKQVDKGNFILYVSNQVLSLSRFGFILFPLLAINLLWFVLYAMICCSCDFTSNEFI